ncbi:MAG: arginine--tRNA ligase [Thermoplasmata archaeon]|nr:arginine--tRNA ligase [Thermoplasmata archaeon]
MHDPWEPFFNEVEGDVKSLLREHGVEGTSLETPPPGMGDLALPCFQMAKKLRKSPQAIAVELGEKLGGKNYAVEVKGPYINFSYKREELLRNTLSALEMMGEDYGRLGRIGKRVIVEHTSANPNGPFHVGRARNPIIGDSLVRILRYAGWDVEAQYWVNDMGKQVMTLVWGVKNLSEEDLPPPERDKVDHIYVRYYQEASRRLEEEDVEERINHMLKEYEQALEDGDLKRHINHPKDKPTRAEEVKEIVEKVLGGMDSSLKRLGVVVDRYVYESQVVVDGTLREVISRLRESERSREEGGAYYLDFSDKPIHGKSKRFFFTRSDGSALYTTRDLAYHLWKLSRCDRAINILGEDHKLQSYYLREALKELGVEKLPEVVFYSFVSLPEGKMSTRKGRVVYLDDLMDEAVRKAKEEVEKRRKDLSEKEMDEIAHIVGIGALRYNIIKVQPEKKITFRWEDALNFDGFSAPFIQYSHARACSILRKAGEAPTPTVKFVERYQEEAELELVKSISLLPHAVYEAAKSARPHIIAQRAYEIARSFNEFYRDSPVLHAPGEIREARLALVLSVRWALSSALNMLGIVAPERM